MALCDYLPAWTPGCGSSPATPPIIPPSSQRPDTADPSRRPSAPAPSCADIPSWIPGGCGGTTPRPAPTSAPRAPAPGSSAGNRPPTVPPTAGEGVLCRWFGLACSTGPSVGERVGNQIGDAVAAAVRPLLGPLTLLVVLAVVLLVASSGRVLR